MQKKCTFLIHKWKNQPQKEFHLFILYRGKESSPLNI